MEISVGVSGAVGGDQQVCPVKVRGVGGQQLDLHREIPQAGALDALAYRAGTGAGGRSFLCLLRRQNRSLIVGGGFPLLKGDGVHGAGGQTVAQSVAVVLPQQLRLAADDADGTLVAGIGAQTAAVALFFVDGDDSSDHGHSSCMGFLFSVYREITGNGVAKVTSGRYNRKKANQKG